MNVKLLISLFVDDERKRKEGISTFATSCKPNGCCDAQIHYTLTWMQETQHLLVEGKGLSQLFVERKLKKRLVSYIGVLLAELIVLHIHFHKIPLPLWRKHLEFFPASDPCLSVRHIVKGALNYLNFERLN